MASGTWITDVSSTWSTAANWSGSVIANGAGFTANFTNNISATRTVTNTIGGTWTGTIGGFVFSDNGLSGSAWVVSGASTITLSNSGAGSTFNAITAATVSCVLAGSESITKSGADTLTLSGINTFGGAGKSVTVSAGILSCGNNAGLGNASNTITVDSGATLSYTTTTPTSRTHTISGNGSSGLNGAIAGAQNVQGTVNLGADSLVVCSSGIIRGTYNLNGYSLTIQGFNNGTQAHTISGSGNIVTFTIANAGNAGISGSAQTYTANQVIVESNTGTANDYALASRELGADSNPVLLRSYGTIFNAANAAATSNHNYTVQNGVFMANVTSLTLNGTIQIDTGFDAFFTAGGTTTCNGVISGGGGIQMSSLFTAPGDLVLTGSANTFTGKFIVPAGTITGSFDRSFGAVPASTTADFFTLSGGTLNASGTVSLDSKRGVTLGANTTFTIASPDYLRINGAIAQNASGRTLTKAGTGSLALGGSNTFSGTLTLSAGTLSLENAGALGGNGGLTISAASCTLDNAGSGAVTLTSTNVFAMNANYTFAGTQNLKLGTGNVTSSASRTITVTAGDFEIAGAITTASAFNVTKAGNGRLIHSSSNAMTGTAFAVNAGSYQVRNASAFGASVSNTWTVSSGAALEVGGSITTGSTPAVSTTGTGVSSNGCLRFVDGTNTYALSTTLTSTTNTIGVEAGTTTISSILGASLASTACSLRVITGATLILTAAPSSNISTFSQLGGGTVTIKSALGSTAYSMSTGTCNVDTGGSGGFTVNGGTLNILTTASGAGFTVNSTGAANLYKSTISGSMTVNGGGTLTVSTSTGALESFGNITIGSATGTATYRIAKS